MTAASSRRVTGQMAPTDVIERERPLVHRLLIVAGITGLIGAASSFLRPLLLRDIPIVTLIEDIRDAAGMPLDRVGLRSEQLSYLHDRVIGSVLTSIGQTIFVAGLGFFLVFLFDAVLVRGGRLPRVARWLALYGSILAAVGTLGVEILTQFRIDEAIDNRQWLADPRGNTAAVVLQFTVLFGWLAVSAAAMYMSVGGMRAGLLTRFYGILGVAVGVLMLPFNPAISGGGAGVMMLVAFWMLMASARTSGRMPSGALPAWETGKGVPWPPLGKSSGSSRPAPAVKSSKRSARRGADKTAAEEPQPTPQPVRREPTTAAPSPATSKKKKRKRRG